MLDAGSILDLHKYYETHSGAEIGHPNGIHNRVDCPAHVRRELTMAGLVIGGCDG